MAKKILVIGGQRSGKSAYAEILAHGRRKQVIYLATAIVADGEGQQRVREHRARRPASWILMEEPRRIAASLQQYDDTQYCLLIDCLAMWLVNFFSATMSEFTQELATEWEKFANALQHSRADLIMVSQEISLGTISSSASTRKYVDRLGEINQHVSALCDEVWLVVAGNHLRLKGLQV